MAARDEGAVLRGAALRARKAIAIAALFMASCGAAALIGEAAFRIAGHHLAAKGEWFAAGRIIRQNDAPVGFSLEPGSSQTAVRGGAYTVTTRISSEGLHDVEHSPRKEPGRRRILLLGDSFMFAPGVTLEQNMARRLAAAMPDVEVMNAGVPGYNMGQEYLYYKDRGARFDADLVILAFFINDLGPPIGLTTTDGADGLPVSFQRSAQATARDRGRAGGWRQRATAWLNGHSLLYVFVRKRLDTLRSSPASVEADGTGRPQEAARGPAALPPEVPAFQAGEPRDDPDDAWRRAGRILDALRADVQAHGSRFAMIIIPAPFQISQASWDEWVRWLGPAAGPLSRRGPQDHLLEWCRRTGTPCLDLFSTFENGDADLLFIPHDLHWTAEGHHLAAAAVSSFLRQQQLP
jgi:GDSL-like lipase/acylhydrolase family protein